MWKVLLLSWLLFGIGTSKVTDKDAALKTTTVAPRDVATVKTSSIPPAVQTLTTPAVRAATTAKPLSNTTPTTAASKGSAGKFQMDDWRWYNWTQALNHCESKGWKLAALTNKAEHEALQKATNNSLSNVWLGGRCETNTTCNWIHGKTKTPISGYLNWFITEPNTKNGEKQCMSMGGASNWNWWLQDCSNVRRFVCRQP